MSDTKKHPGWKNAAEIILERFDQEGYGILFSDKELDNMLDIQKPRFGSYDAFQKFQFERLMHTENLKEYLLAEYNLCLENVRGKGYMLMCPDDQVMKTSRRYMVLARRKINKMVSVLTHVDMESLSDAGQQEQIALMGRAAFVRSAMNKRKLLTG